MPLSLRELADFVGGELRGNGDLPIRDVAALKVASSADVSYVESNKALPDLKTTQAAAVLISRDLAEALKFTPPTALVVVEDAQAEFIRVMRELRPPRPRAEIGCSPHAFIHPSASIGPECNIFPGAWIGENVVLGARCDIHPGAVIGADCRLGHEVTIHPNAVLYHDVALGDRVIIHACAVIGADGFGYRFEQDRYVRIPHTGRVVVEDDVEIGAGATVDRAMIGATVIGAGTKLDNQVMIAHNCVLGKHNAFASQVGFAGSVTTGDYVRCGGQVGVANHAHLGTGCSLGGKAGVSGDVPAGEVYHGVPAGPEKEAVKAHLAIRRLPEMRQQFRQLARQVAELTQQISSLSSQRDEPPASRAA